MSEDLVNTWRRILVGGKRSWVLFKHGTCVILVKPETDLRQQAIDLMREWGPVHAGSPSGDFSTITLKDHLGWAVTCNHPDILTYVGPDEVPRAKRSEVGIGLLGRSKRDKDAAELAIVHIEDGRVQP